MNLKNLLFSTALMAILTLGSTAFAGSLETSKGGRLTLGTSCTPCDTCCCPSKAYNMECGTKKKDCGSDKSCDSKAAKCGEKKSCPTKKKSRKCGSGGC
ncbi:MAG: hypothetical protein SFY92_01725 [Verrucomicrobiae bacterium]|nr:hypothetical protein [Verrucomicrobiae bacterium]